MATTITFLGDTSSAENYQQERALWGKENILVTRGYDYPLQNFSAFLKNSDLVVANLETSMTSLRVSPYAKIKKYIHWTNTTLAPETLVKHNIRVLCLANNHAMDFGIPGLQETLDTLKTNGIEWFGAGLNEAEAAKPYISSFDVGGRTVRIALIGAFEYEPDYDQKFNFYAHLDKGDVLSIRRAFKRIRELKKTDPDIFVIAFPHWGRTYHLTSKRQTLLGHQLVDAEADLIIGHGARMMQGVELFRDQWIVYSIGNFMFNSDGLYQKFGLAPYSLIAQLICKSKGSDLIWKLRLYPILTDNLKTDFQGRFLKKQEFRQAYQLLKQRSPDPIVFSKRVKTGRDQTGYFMQIELE